MTQYHVQYGEMPSAIYAGVKNDNGDWIWRNEVTMEAIEAVRDYFIACANNDNVGVYGKQWHDTKRDKDISLVLDLNYDVMVEKHTEETPSEETPAEATIE